MELSIVFLNFLYAILGGIVTLVFMAMGYKLFDRMTPFNTSVQLEEKNLAVGFVVGSIFIALGIAIGLVIGMGLN